MHDQAELTRVQWHPQVREEWCNERLYFWRISFSTYERERVRSELSRAMEEAGVDAYVAYELLGGYDLLLRVWHKTSQRVFKTVLQRAFASMPNVRMNPFAVTDVITHWPWVHGAAPMEPLLDSQLRARWPDEKIERVNAGLSITELDEFQASGLVAPTMRATGLKFAIIVRCSVEWMTTEDQERTTASLLEVLRKADSDVILEKSLYAGMGFADYLVLGRVVPNAFFDLEPELIEPISRTIAPASSGARTTTLVMAQEDCLIFEEQMRLTPLPVPAKSIEQLLTEPEGQEFEVKGSAFVNLNEWLLAPDPPLVPRENEVAIRSLRKAVVGLLNAEGGTIVVGALEMRYKDNPKLATVPVIGDYYALGLEFDLGSDDWDKFQLRLRSSLTSGIEFDLTGLVDINVHWVQRRLLCTITVFEPSRADVSGPWAYERLGGQKSMIFWVREGNRTVSKEGPALDRYKAEKTRRAAS